MRPFPERPLYYRLDEDKKPVPVDGETMEEQSMNAANTLASPRHVADTTVNGCRISTVFLVIDHNFCDDGYPILFETMIFTNRKGSYKKLDQWQQRYHEWKDAEEYHWELVRQVKHKNLSWF